MGSDRFHFLLSISIKEQPTLQIFQRKQGWINPDFWHITLENAYEMGLKSLSDLCMEFGFRHDFMQNWGCSEQFWELKWDRRDLSNNSG